MRKNWGYVIITMFFMGIASGVCAQSVPALPSDHICGRWMIVQKNLKVEIYREGQEFRAKIIWFNDDDDKSRPMETRLDLDNPDPKMRTQKILGSSILQKLSYKPASNSWENGVIYDALHGHHWDASAYITKKGELKVTGYWHFKFIGKTLTFIRI
ncbi:uncharacterized protein (DUF2147 family) [Mucilaginibacter gracilis]|uniref:Uncharacterized protein (DUF2147 family) n=1 Tax=Mucilaginibacter gracilis TaxID=423350 RepID=A0A495IU71_9SPHI|nr:DUF2147 domain-containing protein [Mucilaginibacter gracilis]RKR80296.1 uncharacterized protein (DUF2147 family) [Mucilaginibacter gracilis]